MGADEWARLISGCAVSYDFVEVRRRTRPMVVFTNAQSVERIIYAIFSRFNEQWPNQNHTLKLFTQAA
jgi:transposase-like protein